MTVFPKEIPDFEKLDIPEGGMTVYLKAGPDGKSVGDCPFAHYVRIVLEEKGLDYDVRPSTGETKPTWLVENYEGKLPALRHRRECYVESDVIAEYLDFFFQDPPMSVSSADNGDAAAVAVEGLFPAVARYLKHTPDGDEEDEELKTNLEVVLDRLNFHLGTVSTTATVTGEEISPEKQDEPCFLTGVNRLTLMDCSLAPKLYHLEAGLSAFKGNAIDIGKQFPNVRTYMNNMFSRPSFQKSSYPQDTIVWGWGNARS